MSLKLVYSSEFRDREPSKIGKIRSRIKENSDMQVSARVNQNDKLEFLNIDLIGELASVPSTKNNHVGRSRTLPSRVRAKLELMDQRFKELTNSYVLSFGSQPVTVSVLIGSKCRGDRVGILETVQDWLEPAAKVKGGQEKSRGWGIGVIEDDCQCIPFAIDQQMIGINTESTSIIIRPFKIMAAVTAEYVSRNYIA